jgi:hypothetical protein
LYQHKLKKINSPISPPFSQTISEQQSRTLPPKLWMALRRRSRLSMRTSSTPK